MKTRSAADDAPAPNPFDRSAASQLVGADLSEEIRLQVEREPGDIVRCTRVGHQSYRCNWWHSVRSDILDNPGMKGGQLGTTYRVRKSSFFDAARTDTEIQLTERPARSARAIHFR